MFQDGNITNYVVLILTLFTQKVIAACPENCNSCDERDSCTSCKTGYWNLNSRCQQTCSAYCLHKDCIIDNGYCIACKPGFYGSQCQQNCSLCESGLCVSRSCTNGCKVGYYEYQDTVDSYCVSCSSYCKSCSNTSVCNVCNDGFYLFKYIVSGKVNVVCVSCYESPECSSFCTIQNCDQCQIQGDSGLLCTQCIDGYKYNGEICISCSEGCSTNCEENGICLGSCNAGWTGERCSDLCTNKCLKCDKINANICKECKGDYYTVSCNVSCYQSCITEAGKQTCRQSDGYCLNGCENKFWGRNCQQLCPESCTDDGMSRTCDRHNGICTNGCVDGHIGDKCEKTDLKTSTLRSAVGTGMNNTSMRTTSSTETHTCTCVQCPNVEKTDTKTGFITGYMSGIGTAIFVVVTTIVLYHLRQRYIARKSKPYQEGNATDEMSTYYNENAAETREPPVQLVVDANNYESLASNRNTEKVYSELESQADQQRHNYCNMDNTN